MIIDGLLNVLSGRFDDLNVSIDDLSDIGDRNGFIKLNKRFF